MLKYFDKSQYALHDAHAKEVARQFWIKLGYDCIENPDEYGVDLLVEGKGRKFGCEVEVKTGWHGSKFNYPTLHIPFRKKKFTKERVTFFVLNNARSHAAVVSRNDVVKSPIVKVPNKMVPSGDLFYDVNLTNAQIINLLAE
jgi:hypothetical protein